MVKDIYTKFGSWVFLIGILIAFIVGLYQAYTLESGSNFFETNVGGWSAWVLAIIGVIVGLLAFIGEGTITKKEIPGFLTAGIALVVMGGVFNGWNAIFAPYLGALLASISMSLSVFIAPAVGITAIKTIWDIGKDR
jgi:hypothetical protein